MTQSEIRLIEEGWQALVDRLGLAEATRFVMLLDRRTGGALQHLQYLRNGFTARSMRRTRRADIADSHLTTVLVEEEEL